MKAKDVGGALGIIGGIGLIGFGMWLTQSVDPLWAIILLIWFVQDFPWSSQDSQKPEDEDEG